MRAHPVLLRDSGLAVEPFNGGLLRLRSSRSLSSYKVVQAVIAQYINALLSPPPRMPMIDAERPYLPARPEPTISAAILAGGHSRRLGTDKALVQLSPNGPPLTSLVIDRLRDLSDDIFLIAPPRPGYERFGVPIHPDRFGEIGPLGGIATALFHAKHDRCLVVSCDMPFLNPDLLRWMIAQPQIYDALVPRLPGESRQGSELVWQTMHAIYCRSALPAIERAIASGQRRATSFLADITVETIDAEQFLKLDPALRSFVSINTPASLDDARRWATELPPNFPLHD